MKLPSAVLLVSVIAMSVGLAAAEEKNLTCVMTVAANGEAPSSHYEKQLMLNESAGLVKFEEDAETSSAKFTSTAVTWEREDSEGKLTNNLSRVTGVLSRHWDGYKRNGMPDYPHSTTTWSCDVSEKKF